MSLLVASASLNAVAQSRQTNSPLTSVDSIVLDAIRGQQIPGAVVVVGHNGQVVYRKAFGERALEPHREAMTLDTIFDIASLTKVVATSTAVMQLVEQGKVRLNDPVAKYLPEFAQNGKDDVTVRELLTHYSGLTEDLDKTTLWESRDTAYRMAFEQKLVDSAGARFRYSDINFIVLGALIERVAAGRIVHPKYFHAFGYATHALSAACVVVTPNCTDRIR